jgi:hypothetical protein
MLTTGWNPLECAMVYWLSNSTKPYESSMVEIS